MDRGKVCLQSQSLMIIKRPPAQVLQGYIAGLIVVALAAVAPTRHAHAGDVPPSADAGRQDTVLSPRAAPRVQPGADTPQSEAPVLPPEIAAAEFQLRRVIFQGATAFSDAELQAIFADLIGRRVTVAAVFDRMAAVQQRYLDEGYVLSRVDIPEQDIAAGDVTIRVIEGYADRVDIASELQDSALVRDVAAEITAMRPMNTKRLERLLLILSTRPGRAATAVLAPSPDPAAPPGAVAVILRPQAAHNQTSVFVQVDNHGSNFLGPWRASGGYRRGALFGSDIDAGVAASVSLPMQELQQYSLDMTVPVLGASGALVDMAAGRTNTVPGGDLDDLDVEGRADFVRAALSYPVILQRDSQLSVAGAFEYKNVTTDLLGDRIFDDRLRVATLSADYACTDGWYGSNRFNLAYAQGFDVLGERSDGVTNISRAAGESAFRKVNASASRVQALPGGVEIMAAVQGQYAWDPLLSAEEFGYGGAQLGRAYDSSEIVGDHGVAAMAEVRYATTLPGTDLPAQPYAFYDIGKVWNIDPGARDKISAASAGVGLRLQLPAEALLDTAVAIPLTRRQDNPQPYADDDGIRLLLSLRKRF